LRAARAEIDLAAVAENVRTLGAAVAPASICAVVKADGYGHGAIAVSEAALAAGASWLGVALVEEGAVLRKAGIEAPILLLSQPRPQDMRAAVKWGLRVTVYSTEGIDALAAAAAAARTQARAHLKIDTGMNRVGSRPTDALRLAKEMAGHELVEFESAYTHCAVADEPGEAFTDTQLDRFDEVIAELDAAGLRPALLHAANSAAAIDHPRARYDMVRAGIALYGISPAPALSDRLRLRPALSLVSEVSFVKRVSAGEGISYGLRHRFDRDTNVATVPIGYADGVPRALSSSGGEVLVGGRRRPITGVITMDQLMVDCGDDDVEPGDEVVLLGAQGNERIAADEWADQLGTIAYEIVCGIGPRVPRRYLR
jgi:alanine racemase